MLDDFARRMGPILDRRAYEVLTRLPLVLDGAADDWVAAAIRNDLIRAEVCRLLSLALFGRASEFGTVFQKMWSPVLDAALPTARQNRKTLHSTRKMANSAMHVPEVKDGTRLYAKVDVNGRHSLVPPSLAELLDAMRYIPVVTTGTQPRA